MSRCDWCEEEVEERHLFRHKRDGEIEYICEECLEEVEKEFYKDSKREKFGEKTA